MHNQVSVNSLIFENQTLERGETYAVYFKGTYSFARTIKVVQDQGEMVLCYQPGRTGPYEMPKTGYTFYKLENPIYF